MAHTQPLLANIGSLITYQDEGGDRCLGYLLRFKGHGVYDPHFGRVEITPENAAIHNWLLDAAMLEGLDQNCEIGMGGSFYLGKQDGRLVIKTFLGVLVSSDCTQHGRVVTFTRGGKLYRGRHLRSATCSTSGARPEDAAGRPRKKKGRRKGSNDKGRKADGIVATRTHRNR